MSKLRLLVFHLRNNNYFASILFLFLCFLVFYVIWTPVYYFCWAEYDIVFVATPNETLMTQSYLTQILAAVIIGPLIETFIFQKGTYKLFSLIKYLKQHKMLIVLLGAIIFGLLHFYSLSYIIYNMFTGCLFMFAYIVKLHKNPYWFVVVLHGLMNLFAIFIDPVEKYIFGVI